MALSVMKSRVFRFSTPRSVDYFMNFPSGQGESPATNTIIEYGEGIDSSDTSTRTLGEDENWRVYAIYVTPFLEIRVLEKSTNQYTLLSFFDTSAGTVYVCIGDDLTPGYTGWIYQYYAGTANYQQGQGSLTQNTALIRRFFADTPLITYTWQSVPAISGKNGILSLTEILNINDGEPVQNITNKGNLDFSKKTKVNTLVNSVYEPTYKEDQTKATIEYEIPEAEYQYTKLVYKKKKIPKSPSDGTAIDIGADDTEAFVSGLDENTTYYFVVFTNRTKSNAYKFKTGKNAPPEGIFKIRITTSQGVKDNDFKEVIEVTRV